MRLASRVGAGTHTSTSSVDVGAGTYPRSRRGRLLFGGALKDGSGIAELLALGSTNGPDQVEDAGALPAGEELTGGAGVPRLYELKGAALEDR
jgi:hypothetical protein